MGNEREFDALASDAIASSEKEFFAEAMGNDEPVVDETGDRSLETMGSGLEGQHEADGEQGNDEESDGAETRDPKAEADGEGDGKGAADRDGQGRFKPKGDEQQQGRSETPAERGLRTELVGEREKRKTVESDFATYRTQMEQRFAALEARVAQAPQPQQPQAQKESQKKDEAPDRWLDPDGYDRWHRDQIVRDFEQRQEIGEQRRLAWSFEEAKAKHGEVYDKAYQAANAIPVDHPAAKQLLDTIKASANPGERLVAWHRQQLAAREIGNDPAAYRDKLIAEQREALMNDPEFRKQVLGKLQAEARGGDDGSRPATKLPPSLSSARGGGLSRAPTGGTSDAELFADVMS